MGVASCASRVPVRDIWISDFQLIAFGDTALFIKDDSLILALLGRMSSFEIFEVSIS